MDLKVRRVAMLQGELRPPSEKSLTHRAFMFGAIAGGYSYIRSPLLSEDCEATLDCLELMGLRYDRIGSDIELKPAKNWLQPDRPLNCGNSGTTMRLLSGLIASRDISATLTGDESLSRRPMKRIAEPLRMMGADFEGDSPPITIRGRSDLHGIDYTTPVPSAQIKSCVLLAGLLAHGNTSVTETALSRDHTERMLRALGVPVVSDRTPSGFTAMVRGGSRIERGFDFSVPADISSAAFFAVAAAIVPNSSVILKEILVNSSRTGILDVFTQSGVRFELGEEIEQLGEPRADLQVESRGPLKPFEISGALVPRLIDDIPVLAVLATQCEGVSRIRDASELRVKESDRIELVANGLRTMGAEVETFPDGMEIAGPVRLQGAAIDSNGDHRIAMAFAIAGLVADNGETTIFNSDCISTSYPGFEKDLWRLCAI